jgi:ATP-dependent RNA helicase DDX10/DBP4
MKYLAQKSFITYLRSIYLQSNKEVFDVHCLPTEEYAESLGLPGAPNIKFKAQGNSKNKSRQIESLDNKAVKPSLSKKKQIKLAQNVSSSEDDEEEMETTKKHKTKIDKLFAQKNHTVLSQHYSMLKDKEEDSDDDLLTIARKDHDVEMDTKILVNPKKKISKTKRAKQLLGLGAKIVFNEDGTAYNPFAIENLEDFEKEDIIEKQQDFLKQSVVSMEQADVTDKSVAKERRRDIKRAKKLKEKELRRQEVKSYFI